MAVGKSVGAAIEAVEATGVALGRGVLA